ncbi:MAG: VWA domain-containing protein [Planctomyces sp.]|nr:VWA domain-containing protein [Planctomyces sp.]
MNFLNVTALFSLSAIVVPILLHLRKRRTVRVQSWAAMRFVRQSLAAQRRGLTIEHLVLLIVRCLMLSVFVMAMARPHVDPSVGVSAIAAVFFLTLSICLAGMAVALVSKFRHRLLLTALAAGCALSAWSCTVLHRPELPVVLNQPRDVVIVIDGSDSMTYRADGQSGFERAVTEAKLLVSQLPGQSTAATLVAGPIVIPDDASLTQNLRTVSDRLETLMPTGGNSSLPPAIHRAEEILKHGLNLRKQILVFSDDQLLPWQEVEDELSKDAQRFSGTYARVLPLPRNCQNVAVTGISAEQPIEGFGRQANLQIEVFNGGTTPAEDVTLRLLVDEKEIHSVTLPGIECGSRTSIEYPCDLQGQGIHTVSAICDGDACLSADNRIDCILYVPATTRVLIVDGTPSLEVADRAATFARLAIDPGVEDEGASTTFASATLVDAALLKTIDSLDAYDVVILCDVPRLPEDVSNQIAAFVANGGGLMILAGRHIDRDFYNEWVSDIGPVMPGVLGERSVSFGEEFVPVRFDVASANHPPLKTLTERGSHDLAAFYTTAAWALEKRNEVELNVGLRFDNGWPGLTESKLGEGRILFLAVSPDPLENNLTTCTSFPVLMNLWTRYLSSVRPPELMHAPAYSLEAELPYTCIEPSTIRERRENGQPTGPDKVTPDAGFESDAELTQPDGSLRTVKVVHHKKHLACDAGTVATPGLYSLAVRVPKHSDELKLPFVVTANRTESDLAIADINRIREIARESGITLVDSFDDIQDVATGIPERVELWKYFILAALSLITAESGLLGWRTRRYSEVTP